MVNINGQAISLDEACLLGIRYYQQRELNEAAKVFRQVIAAEPGHPRALNALAAIESEKGNYAQANVWLNTLLTAHPDFEKGYNTRGMLFLKMKKLEEAEIDFNKAISLNKNFAEAYGNLGNIQLMRKNYHAAADSFVKVINLNPGIPQAYCSLGNALAMLGLHDEAARNIGLALDLAPRFAPAHLAIGDLLRMQGRSAEAVAAYETAIRYQPDAAIYHRSLANAYADIENTTRAQECFLEALRLDPADPLAEHGLGRIYWHMGYLYDSIQACLRGLKVATLPEDIAILHNSLGSNLMSVGRPDEAIAEFRSGLAVDPGSCLLHSNLLLAMHYSAEVSADEIFRESVAWGCNNSFVSLTSKVPKDNHPLRIGFVSADFRIHSVSYFIEPLLVALDRKRFKVYCYSGVRNPDATTERLKSLADCWVDCFSTPDDLLAEQIHAEKIDILVDLSGHTADNRLGVFMRKPAPIQITWLGYPNTTGLHTIDYRITDAIADPAGVADQLHTEKLLRLADCFLCYHPPQDTSQVVPPPFLQKQYVVFGSFNNLSKITSKVLEAWSSILHALPYARLVLKDRSFADESTLAYWMNFLEEHGVEPHRVLLLPYDISKRHHFARYGEIDIALDTFPYNGTTTTCEALWMGVPVITLSGDRHSSRVGASILSCVGLHELVAESPEEYIANAIDLVNSPDRLLSYRQTMRERLLASPLCDAAAFANRWENAVMKAVAERGSDWH